MRWLILTAAALPAVTIAITYGISYWHHDVHQEVPFISGTIDYAPGFFNLSLNETESCIGTFGLSVSAWLQCLIMLVKYTHEAKIIIHKVNLLIHPYNVGKSFENTQRQSLETSKSCLVDNWGYCCLRFGWCNVISISPSTLRTPHISSYLLHIHYYSSHHDNLVIYERM